MARTKALNESHAESSIANTYKKPGVSVALRCQSIVSFELSGTTSGYAGWQRAPLGNRYPLGSASIHSMTWHTALMPPRCQLVQAFGFFPEGQKAKDALERVNAFP